ncbi:UPF0489 family protein [Nisaea sp.]|uniref:UPF0489 family protein n=1 Tax=Nisaea sp. TaxID=2024842 RepID=UPI0032EB7921
MTIPAIIMEEHHEAFLAWYHARNQGWIKETDNRLIHVDTHADNVVPILRNSIRGVDRDMSSIRHFTYNDLNIANFIWPAVYLGLLSEFYWIRPKGEVSNGKLTRYRVFSADEAETELQLRIDNRETQEAVTGPSAIALYQQMDLTGSFLFRNDAILDICLDYFSCNARPAVPPFRVGVTADFFTEYMANPYHPLRIMPGIALAPVEEDGRFYLCCDSLGMAASGAQRTDAEIGTMISELMDFLKAREITPMLITICRSVNSGYTPSAQAAFIQTKLLTALGSIYDINTMSIEECG